MGQDITPDALRGVLTQSKMVDHKSIWTEQSTFTQKNANAGIPNPLQRGTGLQLKTIGTQNQTIKILTDLGGVAGVNGRYKWEDLNGVQYGRDWKNILTDWGYWDYSASALLGTVVHSDAVETVEGVLLVVSEITDTTGRKTISLRKKDKDGPISLVHTFFSSLYATPPINEAHPTIQIMPDGGIIVAHFNYTTQDEVNISAYRSLDGGNTWVKITSRALAENLDISASGYTIKDMRFKRNHILTLWVELVRNSGTNKNAVAQYRCGNSAVDFNLVGTISASGDGIFHSIRPVSFPDGQLGCVYISATNSLRFRRIPNPSIRLSSASWAINETIVYSGGPVWASSTGSELENGDVAIWHQDGRTFIFAREYNTGKIYGFQSDNQGDNWETITTGYLGVLPEGVVYDPGAWSMRFDHMVASSFEGRTALICHAGNSSHILYFGGYSSVGIPPIKENPAEDEYARWESTWNPTGTPDASSYWVAVGLGSASVGINGLYLQTAIGQSKYYTYQGPFISDFTEGQLFRFKLDVPAGGSASNEIAFLAHQDDGVNSRTLNIRFSVSGFDIRDNAGVLQSVVLPMTDRVEFLIGWLAGTALIHYRVDDGKSNKDWILYTATIAAYATGAGNSVRWGHIGLSLTANQSHWFEFYVSTGDSAGQSSEMDLVPAPYPPYPEYTYIDGGMSITALSSPARGGDEYLIEPIYEFAIKNIFPDIAISPRKMWRSDDDLSVQQISFFVDRVIRDAEKSLHQNDVMGIYLGNINFKTVDLLRWTGIAWSLITSINVSEGLQGSFERLGHSIQADIVGNPFFLHYNEAKGWRAELDDGDNKYPVKILSNTEGNWGKNLNNKRAILMIDSDVTDPTTLPTSGTISLIPTSCTVLIDVLDDVNRGDYAFRLEVPPQSTVEGFFQIGSMMYGHVLFIAPQYQRGRSMSFKPNIQAFNSLDGSFFGREMSDGRRDFGIAWTEPVDTTYVYAKDPDYWQLSQSVGAYPVANYGEAPFAVIGLSRYLNNLDPIVYLPAVKAGEDIQILNRYMDHAYVRMSGEITITSVLGGEGVDESFRTSQVNLVEIE